MAWTWAYPAYLHFLQTCLSRDDHLEPFLVVPVSLSVEKPWPEEKIPIGEDRLLLKKQHGTSQETKGLNACSL